MNVCLHKLCFVCVDQQIICLVDCVPICRNCNIWWWYQCTVWLLLLIYLLPGLPAGWRCYAQSSHSGIAADPVTIGTRLSYALFTCWVVFLQLHRYILYTVCILTDSEMCSAGWECTYLLMSVAIVFRVNCRIQNCRLSVVMLFGQSNSIVYIQGRINHLGAP